VELPILDAAFKSDPYPFYDALRRAGHSVARVRLPSGVEAWLAVGHDAARRLLGDARLSKDAAHARRDGPSSYTVPHSIFRHLLTIDPPDHTRLRPLVSRAFSPRAVERLRPRIESIAAGLLDRIAPRGACELIEEYALPLPLRVICDVVGVPEADVSCVQDWSARLLAADMGEPELVPGIAGELHEYLLALAGEKRRAADRSVFAELVAARQAGALSEAELTAMGFLLLLAGHETTVNLIANGTLALLENPPAWRRMSTGGDAAAVVEELLRHGSPLEVATARYATEDVEIEGVRIRSGDMVFVGLGAANRDPQAFPEPDRLDPDRDPVGHLAFGHGIHYCPGAALARLEGEIALRGLARRFPDLELGVSPGSLRWKPGLIMRGLERLPVRFTPRPDR
jgi:cytochrome P450